MYIRKYYPPIMSTLIIGFLFSIFIFGGFVDGQYMISLIMAIFAFIMLHNKIILYEDSMIIYKGLKKIIVDFDLVEGLEIGDYRPALSKVNMSTMFIKLKNSDEKKFYYSFYTRKTINEILETALKRNNLITLDENIKTIVMNRPIRDDAIRKKRTKKLIGYTAIVVILVIYTYLANRR